MILAVMNTIYAIVYIEDWKNTALQRGLDLRPRHTGVTLYPTELWNHWRWELVSCSHIILHVCAKLEKTRPNPGLPAQEKALQDIKALLVSKDSDRSHATRISHKKYLNQEFPRLQRTLLKLKRISLDTSYHPNPKNSCSRCLIQSLSATWVNRWRPLVWYENVSAQSC